MEEQKPKFEMTSEEVDKIGKALKNEEFRKLLVEYAEEISDPVNRERYEKEIAELERERGSDVTFLHPKPGFVLKTYSDDEKTKKVFINICHAPQIQMATATRAQNSSGAQGQNWSVPYSISAAREDLDKSKKRCTVYDVLFNEGTLDLGEQNPRFRQLIIDTAVEGLAKDLDVHVQTKDLHILKVSKYFGHPQSSVLRKPGSKGAAAAAATAETATATAMPDDDFSKKLESMYPYNKTPASSATTSEDKHRGESKPASSSSVSKATPVHVPGNSARQQSPVELDSSKPSSSEPTYKIVQRGIFDIQDFRMSRDSAPGCWPKQLVVKISLPLCRNMSGVELEVLSKEIILVIDKLKVDMEISLPYAVNDENGAATFDKSARQLVVTLNVLPPPLIQTLSPPSNSVQMLDVGDDDEGSASVPEHCTDTQGDKVEKRSSSAVPSVDDVVDTHACRLEDSAGTCAVAVAGSSDLTGPDPYFPVVDTEIPVTDTEAYTASGVLPEFELSQSSSEISVFWHVDSPTGWRVQKTEQKIIMDWNVSSARTRHRAVIAGRGDEQFSLITASCMSSGILVLLAKSERCRTIWKTISIGTSSNSLQVVPFRQAQQEPPDSNTAASPEESTDKPAAAVAGTSDLPASQDSSALSHRSCAAESVTGVQAAAPPAAPALSQGEESDQGVQASVNSPAVSQGEESGQASVNSPAEVEQGTPPIVKLDDLAHPLLFAID